MSTSPLSPRKIGRFEILAELGRGGMGTVFDALDPGTGERVALKLLPSEFAERADLAEIFRHEFALLSRLAHPALVPVREFGATPEGLPFFTMDRVEGVDLARGGAPPAAELAGFLHRLFEALAYVHARGIVHGDLKPSNILRDPGGFPRLLDFGLARALLALRPAPPRGTLEFVAPEILRGAPADSRADLYAAGVLAFELLERAPFFDSLDLPAIRALKADAAAHDAHAEAKLRPVAPAWRELLRGLLAPSTSSRTPSARVLLQQLESAFGLPPASPLLLRGERPALYPSEFVGRTEELARLGEALEAAAAGRGSAFLVEGEAGAGKSRLLEELRLRAFARGARVAFGSAAAGATPLEMLRELGARASEDAPGREGLPRDSVACLIESLAAERAPAASVLLLDDLHALRLGELDALARVAAACARSPLLVVGALRTGGGSIPGRIAGMERVPLEGFGTADLADFVASLLYPQNASPSFLAALRRATGGNPFLVRALLVSVLEEGRLRPADALPESHAWWEGGVPPGVREHVERALGRLPQGCREALEACAVWGTQFLPARARELLGEDPGRFADRLYPAREQGLVLLERAADGEAMRFAQALARDVVYESIAPGRRRELHRGAARRLAGERAGGEPRGPRLAAQLGLESHHLRRAGLAGEAASARLAAARAWQEAGRNREALEALQESLALHRESGREAPLDEAAILVETGGLRALLGQTAAARRDFESAHGLARERGDAALAAGALHGLGDLDFVEGRNDSAAEHLARALDAARAAGDAKRLVRVLRSAGNVSLSRGQLDEAASCYTESLQLAERIGDRELAAGNRSNLGIVCSRLGRLEEAEGHYRASLAQAEALGLADQVRRTLVSLGVLLAKTERLDEAVSCYERSLETARELGYRRGEAVVRYNLAEVYGRMGQIERALAEHERSLAIAREVGDRTGEAMNRVNAAELSLDLARFEEAEAHALEALRLQEAARETHYRALAWTGVGEAHAAFGEWERAREAGRRALEAARAAANPEETARALRFRARVMRLAGEAAERDGAEAVLAEAMDQARRAGSALLLFLAREESCRLLTDLGRHAEALALGAELLEDPLTRTLRRERMRASLARARALLGARDAGEPAPAAEAGPLLEAALPLARELGLPAAQVETRWLLARWRAGEGGFREGAAHAREAVRAVRELAAALGSPERRDGFLERRLALLRFAASVGLRAQGRLAEAAQLESAGLPAVLAALDAATERDEPAPPAGSGEAAPAATASAFPASRPQGSLTTLYEVGRVINSIRQLDALLPRILDLALETTRAERGLIILADEESGALEVRAQANVEETTVASATEISQSIMRDVIQGGSPVMSADARRDPRYRDRQSVVNLNITSLLCVPLRLHDRMIGTVYVDRTVRPEPFVQADLDFLTAFADLAAIAIENAHLHTRLTRENRWLREQVEGRYRFGELAGESPAWRRVLSLLEKVVGNMSTVLIEGESGTGKELVARAIHFNGERSGGRFVAVDCGAIPAELLESEFFGHARGAFTGAGADKRGLFEEAHLGTLFLDEVTNIPLPLQAKLLRVLQEREVRRLGETRTRPVDVRIISASNRAVRAEVEAGRFREDLYYRLHVIPIQLPPLRERRGDVTLLTHRILDRMTTERNMPPKRVSREALAALEAFPWPGNVRELENVLERAVVMSAGEELRPEDLPLDLGRGGTPRPPSLNLRDSERDLVERALAQTGGEIKAAAKLLGISRTTLYSKLEKLGIAAPRGSEPDGIRP